MKSIYFVTTNENKFKEAKEILKDFNIIQKKIDIQEIRGEPKEIIIDKAKKALEIIKKPLFVEDTSLSFNALNGLPGPYIGEFKKRLGVEKTAKLLDGFEDKTAKAIVMVAYIEPRKEPIVFEGSIKGKIVSPRGRDYFDWDMIFVPDGYDKTFAEMPIGKKNKISHRRIALEKLKQYLRSL